MRVGVVERLGLDAAIGGFGRHHVLAIGIMCGEHVAQGRDGGLPGQIVEMQRHAHQHALMEVADGGHEDRPAGEAAVAHDLRQVLMLQREGVEFEDGAVPPSKLAIIDLPPPL